MRETLALNFRLSPVIRARDKAELFETIEITAVRRTPTHTLARYYRTRNYDRGVSASSRDRASTPCETRYLEKQRAAVLPYCRVYRCSMRGLQVYFVRIS